MSVSGSRTTYVPGEVRASAVASLLAARRAGGLPSWRVGAAAADLGVSARTVWRWLEQAESEDRLSRKSRPCFEVSQDDLVELAYHRGNVAALVRARLADGRATPSSSAVRNAFARVLPPGRRAGLESGERARRDFDTYLPRPPGRRRNDCWEADHTQLAVHVVLPDGRVVMPWVTLFLDQATRVLLGWAVAVTASQESVLAALRAAIDVDVPNGPMGGVPVAIRFDNGKEFLAGPRRRRATQRLGRRPGPGGGRGTRRAPWPGRFPPAAAPGSKPARTPRTLVFRTSVGQAGVLPRHAAPAGRAG